MDFNPKVSASPVLEALSVITGRTSFYDKREFSSTVTAFSEKRELVMRIKIGENKPVKIA